MSMPPSCLQEEVVASREVDVPRDLDRTGCGSLRHYEFAASALPGRANPVGVRFGEDRGCRSWRLSIDSSAPRVITLCQRISLPLSRGPRGRHGAAMFHPGAR